MSSTKTQPARGMRDFLPADVRKREYVIGVIKEVYERYGFEPLETPAVENIETLMGKYGEEGNQLIFKILKRGEHEKTGEADLALRYDLTVPLARVVAQYQNDLPKFFKRYQIQPVWRAERNQKGRFREFYQCDVDVIGSRSMVVEAELIAAASDALVALGFNDFTIRLNHRRVLSGLLRSAGVPVETHELALIALDKLDKVGQEGVAEEFRLKGIDQGAGATILRNFAMLRQETNNIDMLKLLNTFVSEDAGKDAIVELLRIVEHTNAPSLSGRIRIDPSLARGLSYYTGAIFEIAAPDLRGSLGGGGRYDNLIGMFLGRDVPACGLSLGLERIIVVMTERRMFPPNLASSPADVLVTMWADESEAITMAAELRADGFRVSLYPEAEKIGKQIRFASASGIPFVVVIGEDERAHGEVSLRDMRSEAQERVKRGDVTSAIREAIKSRVP
jgi:histidyl-tRNA synthetase